MSKLKIKNKRSAFKRFSFSLNFIKCKHSFKNHILSSKNSKRKKYLGKRFALSNSDFNNFKFFLFI